MLDRDPVFRQPTPPCLEIFRRRCRGRSDPVRVRRGRAADRPGGSPRAGRPAASCGHPPGRRHDGPPPCRGPSVRARRDRTARPGRGRRRRRRSRRGAWIAFISACSWTAGGEFTILGVRATPRESRPGEHAPRTDRICPRARAPTQGASSNPCRCISFAFRPLRPPAGEADPHSVGTGIAMPRSIHETRP